jgi:tetratricopeptide (TPR) repeat protein
MRRARASLLLVLLALAGCDASAPGRVAWEEGRRTEALAAWREAVRAAGESASAPLLHDLALAALAAGALEEAEDASRRAAERGGPEFAARHDFVRGNVAFARSEAMEAEANRPGGEATAMERARAHAEDALAAWRRAATSRAWWPEAGRNVERALLRLERLRDRKGTGEQRPPPGPPPTPPPLPPPSPTPPEPTERPARPEVAATDVGPAEIMALLEVLRRKEAAKIDLRRAVRHAPSPGGERDW